MRTILKLGFVSMAFLCGPVWAQTNGVYVGLSFGEGEMTSPSGITQPSEPPVIDRVTDEDSGYKAFVGYRASRFFSLELSWTDYGGTEPEVLGQSMDGGDILVRMDNRAAQFSALGIFPFADGAFELFGRIGASYVNEKLRLTDVPLIAVPFAQQTSETEASSIRPAFGLGMQFNFGADRKFGLRLEWETVEGDIFERTDFFGAGIKYRF